MVYNAAGSVFSRGAVLTVQTVVAPSLLIPLTTSPIQAGNPANLCFGFDGSAPITLQLQRFTGTWVDVGASFPAITAHAYCLTTPVLQLADNGAQFRYVASNAAGQAETNSVTVTVQGPASPVVTSTMLVSRAFSSGPPNNISHMPSISADGRYVAFVSIGTNVSEDSNLSGNAYVRDMTTNSTKLINYNRDGDASSQGVFNVKLSSNGRYALFTSRAGDLVIGDTNDSMDVFRRDLLLGVTQRVSVMPNGDELESGVGGNGDYQLDISADGSVVIFLSAYDITGNSSNNGYYHLFYRNLQSGFSGRIAGSSEYSVAYCALSDDGIYVAYAMGVPAPGTQAVMLYDIEASSEQPLFVFNQTDAPDGLREGMSISSDGRYIAFSMISQVLLGSDKSQVVVVDRNNPGTLINASMILGEPGNGHSAWPEISGDGRYVLFSSAAPSLTNNLANASQPYLVVRDIVENLTTVASRHADGTEVPTGTSVNEEHVLSEDGTTLAFVANYDLMNASSPQFGNQVFAARRP
jgi:Tol biopolymer transport system component